ncbi:uncharacterized protein [Haliotis cracherodii]|uniref:uncharacterized protein n=1 Tax=Haliotis cracherodii TaxID=6455 RepID=UPI0039ED065D
MTSNSDGTDSDIHTGNLHESIRCEYTKKYSSTYDSSDSESKVRRHSDCDGVSGPGDAILHGAMNGRSKKRDHKDSESDHKTMPQMDFDQKDLLHIVKYMQRQILDVKASVDSLREESRQNHEQIMKQLVRIEGGSRRSSLQTARRSSVDTSLDSQVHELTQLHGLHPQVPHHRHAYDKGSSGGGSRRSSLQTARCSSLDTSLDSQVHELTQLHGLHPQVPHHRYAYDKGSSGGGSRRSSLQTARCSSLDTSLDSQVHELTQLHGLHPQVPHHRYAYDKGSSGGNKSDED